MAWIIWLIVVVCVLVVLVWVLRKIGGLVAMMVPLVLLAVVVAFGVWVGIDAYDLGRHFYQDDKLFILDIDGKPYGAFVLGSDELPGIITDLSRIRQAYPDLAALQENNYKVIVMKWAVVENNISIMGYGASANEVRESLLDENPKQKFAYFLLKGKGTAALAAMLASFDTIYPANDAFSSTVFSLLTVRPLQDPDLIYRGIKDGNVIVYPETAVFKTMKVLPLSITKTLVPAK